MYLSAFVQQYIVCETKHTPTSQTKVCEFEGLLPLVTIWTDLPCLYSPWNWEKITTTIHGAHRLSYQSEISIFQMPSKTRPVPQHCKAVHGNSQRGLGVGCNCNDASMTHTYLAFHLWHHLFVVQCKAKPCQYKQCWPQHMHSTCTGHAQDMHSTCTAHAQHMHSIRTSVVLNYKDLNMSLKACVSMTFRCISSSIWHALYRALTDSEGSLHTSCQVSHTGSKVPPWSRCMMIRGSCLLHEGCAIHQSIKFL